MLQQIINYLRIRWTLNNNLTWAEGDTWYGWTFSVKKNRYLFDDIGNQSLMALWEDQWKWEDEEK